MSDKPNDIPQWAWDEAERALVDAYVDHHKDFNPMSNSISVGLWDKFTETFARANLQARSQAFEELRDPTEEMIVAGLGVDLSNEDERAAVINLWHSMISQAIRQPSQKGNE